jgi:FkbM family methyltransferase
MTNRYFAAHEVDKYVESLFPKDYKGYFLDIGAHNGIDINNTYYFEKQGWDGICFEPIPEVFAQLKQNRICKSVQKAISDKEGISQFFKIKGYSEMLSGLVDHYNQDHIARINKEIEQQNQEFEYIDVVCSTFDREVSETNIDILSLDTEGSELSILKSIDFSKYNIKIMIIEYNYHNPELLQLLNDNNFEILQHCGCLDLVVKNKNYVLKK